MADPTFEDFFTREKQVSAMTAFLLSLKLKKPVPLPEDVSSSETISGRRSSVNGASRRMGLVVRTTVRDGKVWVMLMPEGETTKPPSQQ